jgi:hypothetical protein
VISLFSTGDFMRVSIKPGPYRDAYGAVGLLMGVSESGTDLYGIVNGAEGDMGMVPLTEMVSDFIYDVDKDRFIDQSAAETPDHWGPPLEEQGIQITE